MISQFKSLDPSRYQWRQSPDDPQIWHRRALAGENLWIQRSQEIRQLFLGASLSFSSPLSPEKVREAARNAWCRLAILNSHVMVVPSVPSTQDGSGVSPERLLEFCVPVDDESDDSRRQGPSSAGMRAWISKTFLCEAASSAPLGFDDMRLRLIDRIRGQRELISVLSHEVVDESHQNCTRLDMVLLADHLMTDGIGIRVLLGKYLSLIAEELAISSRSTRLKPTSQSSLGRQSLAEPWYNLMNEDQMVSGKSYEAAVKTQERFLLSDTINNWGLPLVSPKNATHDDASPKTAYHSVTLSESQTANLLRAVKLKLGPSATITYLAHAATVIALLRSQPLPSSESTNDKVKMIPTSLFSPCWMNGRPYLSKHKIPPDPEISYIPVCQAMGQVVFQDLPTLQLQSDATPDDILKVLLPCSEQAMRSYSNIKARKSLLSESLPLMDLIGDMIASNARVDQKESADTKPNDESGDIRAEQSASKVIKRAPPFLLSDGICERYVDRAYGDDTGIIFQVHDLKFVANAEGPNLIVRLSTWRDRLSVCGEWKKDDFDRDMIEAYLKDVVDLMLIIVDS